MDTLSVLYHLAKADFYERVRRSAFLLTLAAAIVLGVLVNNGTMGMDLGWVGEVDIRYHGELNSAWIGTMTVMVTNLFLGLFGFYLVSDCIKRDIRTGVGQIIATTPVSRGGYLAGKWISNFVVLSLLVLILAVAAVIMGLLQSDTALDMQALLMPFVAVALPYMALIAALAVVFETVPWLRGAAGNVIYFFAWLSLLMLSMAAGTRLPFLKDPLGYNIFSRSINAAASAAFPNDPITKVLSIGSYNLPGSQLKVFNWTGLDWTAGIVGMQWLWAILGMGLVLLSALWFARFDPSQEGLRPIRAKFEQAKDGELTRPRMKLPSITLPSLSPLISRLAQVNPFLGVLFAELRLLFNGRRLWWWTITIGLGFSVFTSSPEVVKGFLLPAVWLWPLSLWSEMGNRERKHNTSQMVFASARPVLRQLPAAWLAGVLATGLIVLAAAVFFLVEGDLPGLVGWAGAVLFIPSLALALGVISSGSRVFEVIYVIWWYIGPVEKMSGMDFTSGAPQFYLLAAAGLLLLSTYWRGRQVRL